MDAAERLSAKQLADLLEPHVRRRAHVAVIVRSAADDAADLAYVSQSVAFAVPKVRSEQLQIMLGMYAGALAAIALQTTEPLEVLEFVRTMAADIIATDPRVTSTEIEVSG